MRVCVEQEERVVDGVAFCIQEEEGVDVGEGRVIIGCYELGVDLGRVFKALQLCGVVEEMLEVGN